MTSLILSAFGGQFGYYHDSTGLYLLTHRYYDPKAGRFVNRDPIGYGGGINLYGFTGNNPVNRMDPNGTDQADAINLISSESTDIKKVSKSYGIQPDLLAGVVWVESYAAGWPDWNSTERGYSTWRFGIQGQGSLGITKVHLYAKDIPELRNASAGERYHWAAMRDSNNHQSLVDAAKYLKMLIMRPNRYPTHSNNLTPQQMAVILTEYNRGPTHSSASSATPSKYGRHFLNSYSTIQKLMSGGRVSFTPHWWGSY